MGQYSGSLGNVGHPKATGAVGTRPGMIKPIRTRHGIVLWLYFAGSQGLERSDAPNPGTFPIRRHFGHLFVGQDQKGDDPCQESNPHHD